MRCHSPAAISRHLRRRGPARAATSRARRSPRSAQGPPNLACLQAKLNLYNAGDNWLTRQFTLEYGALFDGLLPALDRLRPADAARRHLEPLPRRGAEMADGLGPVQRHRGRRSRHAARAERLSLPGARLDHFRGGAGHGSSSWLRQRTRWIKGYMQTWLVHMRQPAQAVARARPAGFLGFQAMVGGTVLSALVHPWFYALAAFDLAQRRLPRAGPSGLDCRSGSSPGSASGAGYLASMALGFLALKRRGARQLFKPSAADAALLAADLRRRLPRALAIHDRPLRLGEDRARAWSRHEKSRGAFPHAMPQRRLKPATRARTVNTARARGR